MAESYSTKETFLSADCEILSDLPFDNLDASSSVTSCLESDFDVSTPSNYYLSDISVANSECGEEPNPGIDGDFEDSLFSRLGNGEFLTSAVLNSFVDNANNNNQDIMHDSLSLASDIESEDDRALYEDLLEDQTSCITDHASPVSRRKRTLSGTLSPINQWSTLSPTEKYHLTQALSTVINEQLGLREQIEAIRIINPHATVTSTDGELTLDMNFVNDERLRRLQDFIRQHTSSQSKEQQSGRPRGKNCRPQLEGSHQFTNNSSRSKRFCGYASTCHGSSHTENTSHRTQHQMKQGQNAGALRLRKHDSRKINRQQRKEERSGLFVREEVIAVTSCDQDDDPDEVDILQ